jgi:hypothetical protein
MAAPAEQVITWDETLELIEIESSVWIRMAAVLNQDVWQLRMLEATSGFRPPRWEPKEWAYEKVWLVAMNVSGSQLAGWLRQDRIIWTSKEVLVPPLNGSSQVTWDRQASGFKSWFEPLGWPTTEARLPINWATQNEPPGPLIAEGAPSFSAFYNAAASFFWCDRQPVGGQITPFAMYRHAELCGRISHVRVAEDRVEVRIDGDKFDRFTVELAGDVPGPHSQVWDQGEGQVSVTFPLKGGLPSGAWVVLKTGSRWVDRKFLTHPFRQETEDGIEWIVPPMARLEVLLSGHERIGVEFKSEVP